MTPPPQGEPPGMEIETGGTSPSRAKTARSAYAVPLRARDRR
jgi:hypothetical protein